MFVVFLPQDRIKEIHLKSATYPPWFLACSMKSNFRFNIFTHERNLFWFTLVSGATFVFATNMSHSLAMLIHSFEFVFIP